MAVVVMCAAIAATLTTAREARAASDEPYFLVATRDLTDSIFAQSVILILTPRQMPVVVGVIINKPTAVPVQRLFNQAPALKNVAATAFLGGPVEPDQAALLIRASRIIEQDHPPVRRRLCQHRLRLDWRAAEKFRA